MNNVLCDDILSILVYIFVNLVTNFVPVIKIFLHKYMYVVSYIFPSLFFCRRSVVTCGLAVPTRRLGVSDSEIRF